MHRIMWLAALLLAAFFLSACSKSATSERTLGNGLRIIVKEDHRSPVVVSQIWYRVGGIDEPNGKTGMSHVLEHMMFKGTENLKPNEFSRIIAAEGGRENAFTSRDYTAYFQTLEKSRLEIAFRLEAERMQRLKIDDEEFMRELQVVIEERRTRTEDDPAGKLYEGFSAAAYTTHPYRNPIIGWADDLKNLKAEDMRSWYAQFYAPNNATLVVVGDVKAQAVFALAEKYFANIPARPFKRPVIAAEAKQQQVRRIEVKAPARVPSLLIGFHVPNMKSKVVNEPYALDVLAGILDGGKSARLSRELVRKKQIAVSVGAGYGSVTRGPAMFVLSGTPAPGHDVGALEAALLAELARLAQTPVSQEELARVKAQVAASDVYQRDSVFYQAMEIGMLATAGYRLELMENYVARIESVTAAQVQAVARKYFTPENMTVGVLVPQAIKAPVARRAISGGRHAH